MALPDLSNSLYVAWLRYVQSFREEPERRNPDTLVRHFLPLRDRWSTTWMSQKKLTQLRSDPFYYYLVARTKYYDKIIEDAVADGVKTIIGIGCGSDTRPYRFKELLQREGVRVLECDQAPAIQIKQRMASRWGCSGYVDYLPIDLNDEVWPALKSALGGGKGPKRLVMMEGVSPYVNERNFHSFLSTIAKGLPPGSHVAYDYKLHGVKVEFGREGRTQVPFRMSSVSADVARFHREFGLQVVNCELSSELSARLLPGIKESGVPLFAEDGLARFVVEEA
jgi:methyltransferase (TIGR00027 family)